MHFKRRLYVPLLIGCFLASLSISTVASAKPKYTRAQIQQLLAQAKKQALESRLKTDKTLTELQKRRKNLEKDLKKERCTTRENKVLKIRNVYCIRYENGKSKMYLNGRFAPVLTVGMKAIQGLEKFVNDAKKAFGQLAKDIQKLQQNITKETTKLAKKVGDEIDKKAKALEKLAKAKAEEMIKKRYHVIIAKFASTLYDKWPEAKRLGKTKLQDKLKEILRNKNRDAIKSTMQVSRTGAQAAKLYAKTAAISIAISAAFAAALVTYDCWSFDDAKKRKCLEEKLGLAMRDFMFTVASSLVQIAIDLGIIEPLSHTFAGAVASALGAATAGIGAASYPIVYISTSIALNVAVYAAFELKLRPEYNKVIEKKMSEINSLAKSIIGQIPNGWMKCWAPTAESRKKVCEKP